VPSSPRRKTRAPYEASHGGANPYPALLDPQSRYPGYAQYVVLNEIPLNRLQALPSTTPGQRQQRLIAGHHDELTAGLRARR
jgi:hypothetical protein